MQAIWKVGVYSLFGHSVRSTTLFYSIVTSPLTFKVKNKWQTILAEGKKAKSRCVEKLAGGLRVVHVSCELCWSIHITIVASDHALVSCECACQHNSHLNTQPEIRRIAPYANNRIFRRKFGFSVQLFCSFETYRAQM